MAGRVLFLALLLAILSPFAAATGSPGVGWVRIRVGPKPGNSGAIRVTVNGFNATYNYTGNDTASSVATGVAAALNVFSSPVTALASESFVSLTSRVSGSKSNYSYSASVTGASFIPIVYGAALAGGTDLPRNFRMAAFQSLGADTDALAYSALPDFAGEPDFSQAQGHSVVGISMNSVMGPDYPSQGPGPHYPAHFANRLAGITQTYNFELIDAVFVDEPYDNVLLAAGQSTQGNPCSDPQRTTIVHNVTADLQSAAAAVKSKSPTTRFWVNFAANEALWMRKSFCRHSDLNTDYVDVVSMDQYFDPQGPDTHLADFNDIVKPYYDWFVANRGYPGQQMALVPGTFVQDKGPASDAGLQASILEEYFSYARAMNQACNLAPSNGRFTGYFDRCPVWLVAGFLYQNPGFSTANGLFLGLSESPAAPVQAAWKSQLSDPPVANPAIIPIIDQDLDDGRSTAMEEIMMKKPVCFVPLLMLAMTSPSEATSGWGPTSALHVTLVEGTYMPNSIAFEVDGAAGPCVAGTWLEYEGRGSDVPARQANARAIFALLLSAKLSGQTITLWGRHARNQNNRCVITHVYLQ